MPRKPLVSVVMSVYNDRPFVQEAVQSILAQTFTDFELVLFDDASTDGSADYLATVHDPRLRLFRNANNLGLTRTLNRALDLLRGQYIARMDADDISAPERLAKQVEYLEANLDVGILGTSRVLIDEQGEFISAAIATGDDLGIRWKCLLGNPFAHPTVMLRRRVLDAHGLRYDEQYQTAQDYELWTRLLAHTRGVNLPEPLVRYRLRDGVSRTRREEQLENHDRIAFSAIRRLVPSFRIAEAGVTELRGRYGGFSVREPGMDPADAHWLRCYIELIEAFVSAHESEPGIAELRTRLLSGLARSDLAIAS